MVESRANIKSCATRNPYLRKRKKKKTKRRVSAAALALAFKSKHAEINLRFHQQQTGLEILFLPPPTPPTGKMRALRACPRKFAVSFVVPDRVAVEISDRRRVRGSRPLRIIRIPVNGPAEFHCITQAAEQDAPVMRHKSDDSTPDPKKAYHRSRINDWQTKLFFGVT